MSVPPPSGHLFELVGRVALVVGAASGIGRAAVAGLAAAGAFVVSADRDGDGAETTAQAVRLSGGAAEARIVDVTATASVDEVVGEVLARHSRLDVVVSTPAINIRKRIVDCTDDEFDRVVGLNLKGAFRVARAAGRVMAGAGRGSIILLSSIRAQVVEPGQGLYAATKAGIVQLVRALAAELGPHGVRVNALAPGVVETPLTQPIKSHPAWYRAYAEKSALGRWADAQEMVGPIVFLASDASSYLTGTVLFADGGWTAIDGRFVPPLP